MTTFCPACGNSMTVDDKFCRACGRQVSATSGSPTPPGAPLGPPETSGKAVVSLVCGLLFFIPLAFVAAIVFGHLALSEIRKSAGRLRGDGMAIAGLVLGYLWIAGIPIILIIAAIAIPNLLRARMAANESSAVASIRTLNTAEMAYSQSHADKGYTCALSDLAEDRLIDNTLLNGRKNGYAIDLMECSPGDQGAANAKYRVWAHPLRSNQTGVRSFCSDESLAIRADPGDSAQHCFENGTILQ
jgi:type II secretory pathway pseudopilin PulG